MVFKKEKIYDQSKHLVLHLARVTLIWLVLVGLNLFFWWFFTHSSMVLTTIGENVFFSKHCKQIQVGGLHKTVPVLETSKIRGSWFTTNQPSLWPNDGILPTICWSGLKEKQVQLEIVPTFSFNYWIGQLSCFFPKTFGYKRFPYFFSMEGSDKIPNLKPKVPPIFLGPTGMERRGIDEADLKTHIFWPIWEDGFFPA